MDNYKAIELLNSTGLNWEVQKLALKTDDGRETESFGIFRTDNSKWIGTVGPQYTPFQNTELAETLLAASDGVGIEFNRGGLLRHGAKVYLQAQLPSEYIGRSDVNRYITALNSHDGSTSIAFGSSSTVVICQNTFYRAYKELQKFRHTTNAKANIENAIADMRATLELDNKLMDKFKRMADAKLSEEVFSNILKACFDVSMDKRLSEYSTRKKNQIESINKAVEKEIELEGPTLWGLFNGITRYTNHIAVKPENKNEYLMSGTGYKTNVTAFNEIMTFIEANTAEYAYIGTN